MLQSTRQGVSGSGTWTFGIVGMGVRVPNPFQGVNYVELRVEYDIGVTFDTPSNGTSWVRSRSALYSPLRPSETGMGEYKLEVFSYDLRNVTLKEVKAPEKKEKRDIHERFYIHKLRGCQ